MNMSEWSQSFKLTQKVGGGFILCSTPPNTGLMARPFKWRCLLRVLCPVRRSITILDCVQLKDKSLVFAPGLVPEINSWACLRVLLGPHHLAKCWLSIQHFFFLMSCLETPKDGWGPTNFWTERSLLSSAISFPCTPACPQTQSSPTTWQVEISFNTFWHCQTNGDTVLATRRAVRANTHTFLWSNIHLNFTSTGQDSIYLSLKNCIILSYWAFFLQIAHRLQPQSLPSSCTHM